MEFKDLNLDPLVAKAIREENYTVPTDIQKKAIPAILQGRDLLAKAQTGTGKTAAFALPILHQLSQKPRMADAVNPVRGLVLAPTRELAIQIGESFSTYGKYLDLQIGVVYGGVTPKRHIKVLKREPDVLVATPGRLLDLQEQGILDLSKVEFFVLDEADRMLDLGMIKDVKRIIQLLPRIRQNMLFSATMQKEVMKFVHSLLRNPISIEIKASEKQKKSIQQTVYFVDETDKTKLLLHLLKENSFESVLIFVRTKKKADIVAKALNVNNIRTKALHGDKNQSERMKVLEYFKTKEVKVLVATDIAARGIDIDQLSHVINMDIPNVPESYVHRIGRTGRAGFNGTAISMCSLKEMDFLRAIEKHQGKALTVIKDNPYPILSLVLEENRKAHGK